MASAPQNSLPLFYNDLVPLNSTEHGDWTSHGLERADFLSDQHAIPITAEEFPLVQRHFPIVFSGGDNPVPLALMGLNEGANVFVKDGRFEEPVYIPAYVRRYPFLLARLKQDSDELTLCFDPTVDAIGPAREGEVPLFEDGQPSETTRQILKFCEDFEEAGARTFAFMEDLKKSGLLMEGEVAIQQEGVEQPFLYRGFQMVDEAKLRELRGDELRRMNQNGMLPLIYSHLLSLQLMRDIFARQVSLGMAPEPNPAPLNAVLNA